MEAAQVTDADMGRIDFHDEVMTRDELVIVETGMAIALTAKEEEVMDIKCEGFAL